VTRPDPRQAGDQANVVRHTIWCDQFTYEGEEIPLTPTKDAEAAYCAVSAAARRSYDFDQRGISKGHTSYRLAINELKKQNDVYHVTGTLSQFDNRDRDTVSETMPFQGTLRGVDPAASSPEKSKKPAPSEKTRKGGSIFDQARQGTPFEKPNKAPA